MLEEMALTPDVRVIEDEAARPSPSPAVLARVDALFERERARRGRALFDGKLFSVSEIRPGGVRGWFADYRWWAAQHVEPSLFEALRVRPLGVTGLVRAGDSTLFGRRSANVLTNAGRYELAPSGGVEPSARDARGELSLVSQVLAELVEELALAPDRVALATPLALIEDHDTRVLDACVEIRLDLSRDELLAHLASIVSDDYDDLVCVSAAELSAWSARVGEALDRVSRAALVHAGLLPAPRSA